MLRFRLVTPDRVLFDQEVLSVSVPTPQGEMTVLNHHVDLASLVASGVLRLKTETGMQEIAVSRGFLQVTRDGQVTALTDTAERGEELDVSVIEEAKKRAEDVMKNKVKVDDASFAAAASALERELARYKVASRYRRGMRNLPLSEKGSLNKKNNQE